MYAERLASLYDRKEIPFVLRQKVLWRVYQRMVEPHGPVATDDSITASEAKALLSQLGGQLVRWTGKPMRNTTANEQDWYAVLSYEFNSLDKLKSKRRYELKQALKNCQVERVEASYIAQNGYPVYTKAHQQYRNNQQLGLSESQFRAQTLIEQDFPDLIQYFGVFCEQQLVGYSKCYSYDDIEANDAVSKFDPAFLERGIAKALAYHKTKYYLEDHKVAYFSAGYRAIEHQTQVHEFYCNKFHFQKVPVPLFIHYPLTTKLALPFLRTLQNFNSKVKAICTLDRLATNI